MRSHSPEQLRTRCSELGIRVFLVGAAPPKANNGPQRLRTMGVPTYPSGQSVLRDQILRHARGQGNINLPCSADRKQDWQPYPVDPYSARASVLQLPS